MKAQFAKSLEQGWQVSCGKTDVVQIRHVCANVSRRTFVSDQDGPVSKTSDIAYAEIRAAILAGKLPPGTHLRERELAESMGISRTPVRDAIRRLAADPCEFRDPFCSC